MARLTALNIGDRVVAVVDSMVRNSKGVLLYTEGMAGEIVDERIEDGQTEFKVDFDDKDKLTWVKATSLKAEEYYDNEDNEDDDYDCCQCDKPCIHWEDDDFEDDEDDDDYYSLGQAVSLTNRYAGVNVGDIVEIVEVGFGYYNVLVGEGRLATLEKQDVFVIPDNGDIYLHIMDLRKLRALGLSFDSNGNLNDKCGYRIINACNNKMIDKSFIIERIEDDHIFIKVSGEEKAIPVSFLSQGYVELRD